MSQRYRLLLVPSAHNDLEEAYLFAARRAPEAAARWYNRFLAALRSLESRPERGALSRENSRSPVEIRDFLFGRRPYVYRAVYTIRDDQVVILRIRRGQRRQLNPNDVRDALDSVD